ncbi:MAG: hypothetical protein Q7U10_03070 [Thermodesulfovibrionia bacterium]|nr:hypothetical protein [Thermodesulfovibrionia bacterium]
MVLIESLDDLKANLLTLEKYRNSNEARYTEFYKEIIRRGACFIVYMNDENIHFAPSRFIGYKNNNMNDHIGSNTKDGRVTNPVIDKIIGNKSEQNRSRELEYMKFCNELGVDAWKRKKKFWETEIIVNT